MRRLFANANYDFIAFRRYAYVVSAVLLAVGLGAAILFQATQGSWLRYGVDFTGGTLLLVEVNDPAADLASVRDIVSNVVREATVNSFGDAAEYQIRTPTGGDGEEATAPADAVLAALRAAYGDGAVVQNAKDSVSAKVGGELQVRALIAILISLGATLIYIAFRFEWRFGVASVIATAHDVLATVLLLILLRVEVSLPTVAAVLTIVGYSLNDTIIIFDRVRENMRGTRRESFVDTLNRSINETLPRTVLTSGTTLVTLLALYLFGGMVIRDFAMILILGIILGTYSSIFVAAPALYEIEKRYPHQPKQVRRTRTPATTRA